LLQVGKEELTTTKVARRAGVSVGTLYQYFPNKSALLRAALKRHIDEVTAAIELACHEQRGKPLEQMAAALITAYLAAKMRNAKTSVAFYAISSDVGGAKIVQEMGARSGKAIAGMLQTAGELTADPHLIASMLQGVMIGVGRRLLEAPVSERQFHVLREETIFLAGAYLNACCARGLEYYE
jgi:AcrR family transcriptional regulator